MADIELPSAIVKATAINPESLILFGLPKCGKTTAISTLENCLLIDIEGGSNFVDAVKIQPQKEMGPVNRYRWLTDVAKTIRAKGKPYDYVAIDTISYLDEMCEWVGTYNYMNSVQGKKFNTNPDGSKKAPTDEGYESVHNMPEGYGYRWSREAMLNMFDSLKGLGRICTIFVCHVADKYVLSKLTNQEVRVVDLSLTGKLKGIISRDVDAIGYVYNEDGKLRISFKGNEERTGGIRGNKHIQGFEGVLDWKKIFVPVDHQAIAQERQAFQQVFE